MVSRFAFYLFLLGTVSLFSQTNPPNNYLIVDSIVTLNEKGLGFKTQNYPDRFYRVFVEVFDLNGNSTLDSMDVNFKNGISGINDSEDWIPTEFTLYQNYPNPFNPVTTIKFSIPSNVKSGTSNHQPSAGVSVKIGIFDVLGREVSVLVNEEKQP